MKDIVIPVAGSAAMLGVAMWTGSVFASAASGAMFGFCAAMAGVIYDLRKEHHDHP